MNMYLLTSEVDGIKPILGVFETAEAAKAYVPVENLNWSRPDMLTGSTFASDSTGFYAGYTIELVEVNPERKR